MGWVWEWSWLLGGFDLVGLSVLVVCEEPEMTNEARQDGLNVGRVEGGRKRGGRAGMTMTQCNGDQKVYCRFGNFVSRIRSVALIGLALS